MTYRLTQYAHGGWLRLQDPARCSGGLMIAGEIPGAPVIGELVPGGEAHNRRALTAYL